MSDMKLAIDKRVPRGGHIKWLPAKYGGDGSVRLGGRLALIHSSWRALFMKLAPGCLDRLGRIIERLGSSLEDLLSVRPIGVVEREKSQLLVVSHVDLFCLATERRLEWIPVYYLPENVDCESIVRLDGLLDPLLSANRSDANRLIRTIREAEEKGMPLIASRRHPNGTYSITVEDLAYLMQRDESTLHTKLGAKHKKQGQKAQSDQNNAIHSVAEEKETDQ